MVNTISGQRILIAVLDWGLGHAARSMALAIQLRQNGNTIFWAAAGKAKALLLRDCPSETVATLTPYAIRYDGPNMHLNIARQLPKIWRTIRREQREVDQLVSDYAIDLLISDSRFGAYSRRCHSVLLTHQLQPIFGVPLAQSIYQRWLNRFDAFWIPDLPPPADLSGQLSQPFASAKSVHYVGWLSRLLPFWNTSLPKSFDTVCLLSGPEPARTQLQRQLIAQLQDRAGTHIIIQGLPDQKNEEKQLGHCQIIPYTNGPPTAYYLQSANRIICRSGYSTIMDLAVLGLLDRATLIPTPGQTEQEYLAQRIGSWTASGW
ncbi:MAG: glycosyltransferase [Bacteroidota bacterium]